MKPTVAVLYGDAGSAALIHAMKAWRQEYAPSASYDSMFAEHIRTAKIQTTLWPGGRSTIHVRVEGRLHRHSDDWWFEATVAGGELKLESID